MQANGRHTVDEAMIELPELPFALQDVTFVSTSRCDDYRVGAVVAIWHKTAEGMAYFEAGEPTSYGQASYLAAELRRRVKLAKALMR